MRITLGHLPFVAFEVMDDAKGGNVWSNAEDATMTDDQRRTILKAMDALSAQWHADLDPATPEPTPPISPMAQVAAKYQNDLTDLKTNLNSGRITKKEYDERHFRIDEAFRKAFDDHPTVSTHGGSLTVDWNDPAMPRLNVNTMPVIDPKSILRASTTNWLT